ncbi:LytTR family DNA-binding domain-containing protein [Mucilaginibacter sp. SMC90]|uniref:LytR/AlgR family response regulator transcription factor n=1 Tax=Mucilaginibacter sp. SMC90 TaxID=2929803 RepID=UPI001FB30507|nr:LytTR family DNA-binding domain-containing protein [Mucilaginibacter sp. SMC90]UOE47434.1 LytTR family DNA-binding domain-containing protein [Mucilaginibacter sp. SMC90]
MISAIAIDDEPLALTVLESLCKNNEDVHLLKTLTQPNEALKYLGKFPVDLVFCDIHMPAMTGIRLVKYLQPHTMVVFTTAFAEYAVTSYELNAIDYLLKPINQKRFTQAVNKAKDYAEYMGTKEKGINKEIYVRADFSLIKILADDIRYIEGLADYLKIHIKDRKTVVARMSMKEMIEKLNSDQFIRVHRSYILPFKKIEAVRRTTILIGDQQFPIGKTYVDEFFARYNANLG